MKVESHGVFGRVSAVVVPALLAASMLACGLMYPAKTVDERKQEILAQDLLPEHRFEAACGAVLGEAESVLVANGFQIASRAESSVLTEAKYLNQGGREAVLNGTYTGPKQTRVVTATVSPAGSGCQLKIAWKDVFGGSTREGLSDAWMMDVVKKLEPQRTDELEAEALKRAQAENEKGG